MADADVIIFMELWYQIHLAFVGIRRNQGEWFLYQFRGQQVEEFVLFSLALLLCECWSAENESYKN